MTGAHVKNRGVRNAIMSLKCRIDEHLYRCDCENVQLPDGNVYLTDERLKFLYYCLVKILQTVKYPSMFQRFPFVRKSRNPGCGNLTPLALEEEV
jgi:hypothetical protein